LLYLQPLLHDEQCIDGGVAFQPKLHLQQIFPLLCPKPYKDPKTTKLNPNTLWMKQNYKKTIINIDYYFFLPFMNHSRFMEFNTCVNSYVWLTSMDSWSQFLTSHAIFNHHAYVEWVDRIISYKFSSFSIRDVAFQNTFPMPHALRPNTCNNYSEINLTKVSFGNGGHCFTTITNLSHSHWALARAQLVTFWSFCLYTAMDFSRCKRSF
jgi:hypothetical protein